MSAPVDPVQEEAFYRALRVLAEQPHTSQRELAREMGVSLGKTHYCLKALLDKGLVKALNFRNSRNKLGYVYQITPAGVAAKAQLTGRFLRRKMAEYEALRREIEQLRLESGENP